MIFDKISALIAEQTGCDISDITRDSTFSALGIDSLDIVEMLMQLEEEMDMDLEIETRYDTIGEFCAFAEAKISEAGAKN